MENINAVQTTQESKTMSDQMIYHPHDIMTRDQAIAKVGLVAVERAENDNCEPTGRLMPAGCQDMQEWAGQSTGVFDVIPVNVRALYYPTDAEIDAAGEDLSYVDWRIDGYTIR
jgi:hypothetical protein